MKVVVDRGKCSGHARCNAISSGLYDLDDLGYLALTDIQVPEHRKQEALDGAAACPERAITILDDMA